MDAKDIRNLQEAYLEVYSEELEQLDELSDIPVYNALNQRIANTSAAADRAYKHRNPEAMRAAEKSAEKEIRLKQAINRRRKRQNRGTQLEQVDIYDIILSHLLDEGYAETVETAEAIMVNMSEEWRDSIIDEEQLDEMRKEDKVKGEKKTPLYTTVTRTLPGKVEKPPGGSWKKVSEPKTFTNLALSPRAATGRSKQDMKNPINPYETPMHGAARHAHGGGGSGAKEAGRSRNIGKLEQQEIDRKQRESGVRPFSAGPSPAEKVRLRQAQQKNSTGGGNR